MISMIEHIEYLMSCNDCVIVPGWGALIAQYEPSAANEAAGVINKPRRCVSFNASVSHNDGLLAQSIVRRDGVTYDEAMKSIASHVALYRQLLEGGEEVPFGKLGFFKLNSDSKIEFTPFYHASANDEFFGLKSIKMQPLAALQQAAQQSAADATRSDDDTPAKVISFDEPSRARLLMRSYMRIAASIIVLLGLYFMLSTPVAVDFSQQDTASLSIPQIKQQPRQTIKRTAAAPKQQTTAAVKEQQGNSGENQFGNGRYYLIVSTFRTKAQAEKYVAAHTDLNAGIRLKGNTYRVYVARSNDYCELIKDIDSLPAAYQNAWVSD